MQPITSPLALSLSTGQLPATQVTMIRFELFSVADLCQAIALWVAGEAEPRYFPCDSSDAQALIAWAALAKAALWGELFLFLPGTLVRSASIATTLIDDDSVQIFLDGDPLPFHFSSPGAVADVRNWACGDETMLRQAITLV